VNIIIITHIAQLPGIARRKKIEKEGRTQAGLYLVEKVPAVTIIEINAEPASLTSEKSRII